MAKVLVLAALLGLWALIAWLVHSPLLGESDHLGEAIVVDTRSGELPFQMALHAGAGGGGVRLAFTLGAAGGYAMGRSKLVDRYADPWLVVLLNLRRWSSSSSPTSGSASTNRGDHRGRAQQASQRHRGDARGRPFARSRSGRDGQAFQFTWRSKFAHVVISATGAVSCGGVAIGAVDHLEDRAGGRTAGTANGVGFVSASLPLFDMTGFWAMRSLSSRLYSPSKLPGATV